MRFHRNHYHTEGGISAGFSWHTCYADAIKAACDADNSADSDADKTSPVAEIIDIQLTKESVLLALQRYASHPDNG